MNYGLDSIVGRRLLESSR